MSAPIAVATLFASQLFLVDAPLAAEEKDFIDPRNDVFEQNHPDQYHSWKATSESEKTEEPPPPPPVKLSDEERVELQARLAELKTAHANFKIQVG